MLRPSLLTLSLLAACSGTTPTTPADTTWKGHTMDSDSGQQALLLDRLEASYELSASNIPDALANGTFLLDDLNERRQSGNATSWAAKLPFVIPKAQRRFAPVGMRVFSGDTELVFNAGESRSNSAGTWHFDKESIVVWSKEPVEQLRIEHPAAVKAMRRLNWSTAEADGLSSAQFVRQSTSLGSITRQGLALPAPSTATWRGLTLPSQAKLQTHLGMVSSPIASTSDGARVILEISSGGETKEVATRDIDGQPTTYEPWTVDLSAYAGKTVDVTLRTEPGETNAFDYVFLGSPAIVGPPDQSVRRVLVIGIDTLRPDHLSVNGYERNTTPDLDAWSQGAYRFERAWTSAPRTRPSFRAATTGRLPLEAVCAKNIGEVFSEHGFATAGIVSNVHLNPRFDFHKGFDMWQLDGAAKVNDQVERAKDFFDENIHRDVYMFLHVMDPHIFYRAPEPYGDMFTSELPPLSDEERLPKMFNRWQVYKWARQGNLSEARKAWIEAAYDGELAYTSHELSKLLKHIETLPGENVVVIHNDHGEEFWEHGGFEHNHTLYDDTTRALMWVKPPGGSGHMGAVNAYPTTLQDIGPTVFELAGIEDTPPTDGKSLVAAMRGSVPQDTWARPIPIGHLRYDADRWGVVWNDHKYVLITGTGQEELYDLKGDPSELTNIASSHDTTPYWQQLGAAHGITVSRGWRVGVQVKPGTTVRLNLPRAASAADVLDPETITRKPANQVWGEKPRTTAEDVGKVTLTDNGKTVQFTAGTKAKGTIYVLFEEDTSTEGTSLQVGDDTATPDKTGKMSVNGSTLTIREGIVIVPPVGEAQRIAACSTGEGTQDEVKMLEALGYVGGDE